MKIKMILALIALMTFGINNIAHGMDDKDEALFWATHDVDRPAVERLLKEGANPNGHRDYLPLRQLPGRPNREEDKIYIAQILLHNPYYSGKDANIENSDPYEGKTALTMAAQCLDAKMVEFLLKEHANPHHADNKGNTPLHFVARREIRTMKCYGQDTTEVDLQIAQVTKLLLDYGASLNARNNQNETPLHAAKERDNTAFPQAVKEWQDKEKREKLFKKQIFSKAKEKEFEDVEFKFAG